MSAAKPGVVLPLHAPTVATSAEADRLRAIIDTALDAVVCIDSNSIVLEWNQGAENLFGWRKSEAVGIAIGELIIPPRLREAHMAGLQRYLAAGVSRVMNRSLEVFALHRSGQELPIELAIWPIQTAEGLIFGAFLRDIRARREAEARQRQRTERALLFRDALYELSRLKKTEFDTALATILAADARAMQVERASFWLLSHDQDKIRCAALYTASNASLDVSIREISAQMAPNYFAAIVGTRPVVASDAVNHEATAEFASNYLLANGIGAMLDVAVWYQGKVVGVVCHEHVGGVREWSPEEIDFATSIANMVSVALEAADRFKLSEALRLSEERYRCVVDNAKEGIIVTQDAQIKFANPYAYELSKYDRTRPDPSNSFELVHPDDRSMVLERYQKRLRGEPVDEDYSYRILDSEGKVRWLHTKSVAIQWEGRPATLSFLTDVTERKELQDSLQQLLAEQEAILNTTAVGITLLEDRTIRWGNPTFAQMLGYERSELIGKSSAMTYSVPDEYEPALEKAQRQFRRGETFSTEVELQRRDGSRFWCLLRGRALAIERNTLRSIWVVEDIDEQKRADVALKARATRLAVHRQVLLELASLDEANLRTAMERILSATAHTLGAECTIAWNLDREQIDWSMPLMYRTSSAAWELVSGVDLDADVHRDFFDPIRQGRTIVSHDATSAPLFASLCAGHSAIASATAVMGLPVWSRGRVIGAISVTHMGDPRHWHDDEVQFAQSIAKTASLAVEAAHRWSLLHALSASEEKYRHVVENASEAIVVVREQRIVYGNPAVRAMMGGVSLEALHHQSFLELFHPDEHHRILTNAKRRLRGQPAENDYIIRASGRLRSIEWLRAHATLIKWEGQPAVLAILKDVTEDRRVEIEMRNALAHEKELSELKSRFVSMTSHEFRTPLATILSSTQLLEDYGERLPAGERAELLSFIRQCVGRMTQMLDDVLVIGRSEAGRLEFNPRKVALREFCTQLVNDIRMGIGAQHDVVLSLEGSTDELALDEKLMFHVLNNLLSNAIKYSSAGSQVLLDVQMSSQSAKFTITDSGLGIPPKDLAHAFETFHRGSNVGNIVGTGLGLAIVKRAVDLHGGNVDITSQVGKGTRVCVTIPIGRPA